MLSCGCRRKETKQAYDRTLVWSTLEAQLLGSNLAKRAPKPTLLSLVTAALPSGTIMAGVGPNPVNSRIVFAPNSSNVDGEPAFPIGEESLFAWETPVEIWGSIAQLFIQDHLEALPYDFSDVNQGKLHNCWLISAIASLCRYGTLAIPAVFASISPSGAAAPTSMTINLYNQDSTNFFQSGGAPVAQTVDWKVAVLAGTDPAQVAFAHSDTNGEYWPCMVEKAVAAAANRYRGGGVYEYGYDVMDGNVPSAGMSMLTPGLPASYNFSNGQPTGAELYATWDACMATGVSIGLSWQTNPNGLVTKNGQLGGYYGLFPNLSYLVMSLVSANGMQMALIRFPFGKNGKALYAVNTNQQGEWVGPWSDYAPEWNTPLGQAMRVATGFAGPRSDGLFWMDINDVAQYLLRYDIFIPSRADMRAVDLRPSPLKNGCLATQVPNSNFSDPGSLAGYKGDVASIVCNVGYTGGGNALCLNGSFDITPCTANPCTPNSVFGSDYQAAGSLVGSTGDVVTVTCKPGYVGGGDATCMSSGRWHQPKCTAVGGQKK